MTMRTRPSRRGWRGLAATCGLGAALAGCGSSGTVIDHTVVEKAIEISIAQQQHIITIVSCPKGVVAHTGERFYCSATLASGRQLLITVVSTDSSGNVSYAGFNGFVNGRPATPGS